MTYDDSTYGSIVMSVITHLLSFSATPTLFPEQSSSVPEVPSRWHQPSAPSKGLRTDNAASAASVSSSAASLKKPASSSSSPPPLISPSQFEFPFSPPPASSYLSQNFICESGTLYITFWIFCTPFNRHYLIYSIDVFQSMNRTTIQPIEKI